MDTKQWRARHHKSFHSHLTTMHLDIDILQYHVMCFHVVFRFVCLNRSFLNIWTNLSNCLANAEILIVRKPFYLSFCQTFSNITHTTTDAMWSSDDDWTQLFTFGKIYYITTQMNPHHRVAQTCLNVLNQFLIHHCQQIVFVKLLLLN